MVVVPEVTPETAEATATDSWYGPEDVPAGSQAEPATAVADAAETSAEPTLPVPVGEPRQRRSLWTRLSRRRDDRTSEPSAFQEMVKSRLDGITLRLESFEHGLTRSEARHESRFELLERIEQRLDALADVADRADQARDAARQAAEAATRAAGTARIAAILAGIAVVISALAAAALVLPLA